MVAIQKGAKRQHAGTTTNISHSSALFIYNVIYGEYIIIVHNVVSVQCIIMSCYYRSFMTVQLIEQL